MNRRRALALGLVTLAAYAALAGLSGRLSPLARGPLLDGLGPPQPYRWVSPPPDLAATNQPPSSGMFHVPLDTNGSRPEVFVTSDNQVTVIVPAGVFRLKAGQVEVKLTVAPVDPATLSPPGPALTVFGNAYRVRTTYQPSNARASFAAPLDVVLVYPVTTTLHASSHAIYTSPDGAAWEEQQGSDSIAQQQAEGPLPTAGYMVVAGKETANPSASSPPTSSGGSRSVTIILIVAAVCIGLVGVGLLLRNRR